MPSLTWLLGMKLSYSPILTRRGQGGFGGAGAGVLSTLAPSQGLACQRLQVAPQVDW